MDWRKAMVTMILETHWVEKKLRDGPLHNEKARGFFFRLGSVSSLFYLFFVCVGSSPFFLSPCVFALVAVLFCFGLVPLILFDVDTSGFNLLL